MCAPHFSNPSRHHRKDTTHLPLGLRSPLQDPQPTRQPVNRSSTTVGTYFPVPGMLCISALQNHFRDPLLKEVVSDTLTHQHFTENGNADLRFIDRAYNDRNTSNAQQPQYSRSAYDSYNTSSTQQQQYSRVGDSLAAKMSGLQLQGQRSTNSSKTSQNVVTVKWSDRQQAYYWCKDGVSAHKAVDTHSRKNGKLWVSMSGTWYPANEIRVR